MQWFAIMVALGLVVLALAQFPAAASFVRRLRRRSPPVAEERLPKTAVVLCLRGADATLERCLEGLLTQDYPRYDVVIIVDHVDDPAWGVAWQTVQRQPAMNVRVEPLAHRLESCSLKCSSLMQAISGLDDSYGAVALLDADTVPHASWLRELVTPLADANIGAVAGVRWYMPSQPTWGAVVRYLWNVPAIMVMYMLGIAWGGTLAFKRDVFRKASLLEKWAKAYCEDTMTFAALRPVGLRLVYVPALVTVHRDSCRLGDFFEWCVRQMLTSRLYHPGWRLIVAHGLITSLAWAATVLLVVWAAAARQWESLAWLAGGLLCYWSALVFVLLWLERNVQRVVFRRGEPTAWLSPRSLGKLIVGIPLTQLVYCAILVATLRVRRVCWRGIWYEIGGPWNVRLCSYQPYSSVKNSGIPASPESA